MVLTANQLIGTVPTAYSTKGASTNFNTNCFDPSVYTRGTSCTTVAETNALGALYTSTVGASWSAAGSTNWKLAGGPCVAAVPWGGVTCTGFVVTYV